MDFGYTKWKNHGARWHRAHSTVVPFLEVCGALAQFGSCTVELLSFHRIDHFQEMVYHNEELPAKTAPGSTPKNMTLAMKRPVSGIETLLHLLAACLCAAGSY